MLELQKIKALCIKISSVIEIRQKRIQDVMLELSKGRPSNIMVSH